MGANCCSCTQGVEINNEIESDVVERTDEFTMSTIPKKFSYDELFQSTAGFAHKLGEGGCSEVYKGFLEVEGIMVAVKRLSRGSERGIKQFFAEAKAISLLRHRYLVQLMGWCYERGEVLLVYQFMENGSLDEHLFSKDKVLAWPTRYKIARDLATALLYLHEGWEDCVLHRDVKCSNVLLNSTLNMKLGDFGLAMLLDHTQTTQTITTVTGTPGYMAPEYERTGRASKESDVYSFGVVALELACGRKPTFENGTHLSEWVCQFYETENLLGAADRRLRSDFEEQEMIRLMYVGLCCVQPDPNVRLLLGEVIRVLKFEAPLPEVPSRVLRITNSESPTSIPRGKSVPKGYGDSLVGSTSHGNLIVEGKAPLGKRNLTATF